MNLELPKASELAQKVFSISNAQEFNSIALQVYHFQYCNNSIYHTYCNAVFKTPETVRELSEIPFLPVSFFKTHRVVTTSFEPELIFKSSGSTGMSTSSHYIKDAGMYEKSFSICFEQFFGSVKDYCIIGLLPSYLEKGESSLVYMVQYLVKKSGHPQNGFYLYDFEKLYKIVAHLENSGQQTILFGVTYALIDFAANYPLSLKNTLIVETGGMKGRRKEITKNELYNNLKKVFAIDKIYSEYGMTELLSQAYSVNGIFKPPAWMKILMRDETDPLSIKQPASVCTGVMNVIDLANIFSCSFIATDDVGKLYTDGSFEVLGRMDNSDLRGCSLLTI